MASGVPVVAVAAGGLPEIVSDGRTGYLYPSGDVPAAAAAVRRLLDDPAGRAVMAATARSEVEKWGWQAATDHLRGQYARAMRRRETWNRLQGLLVRVALLARLRRFLAWLGSATLALVTRLREAIRPLHPLARDMKLSLLMMCSLVLFFDFYAHAHAAGVL